MLAIDYSSSMSLVFRFCISLMAGGLFIHSASGFAADKPMSIVIDARDLPRQLLTASLAIPCKASNKTEQLNLWYPKWVPGSHGPGGPIANVAGFEIANQDGVPLEWKRAAGEVYCLQVTVPAKTEELRVRIRYIANQPTTNSMGHDTFSSSMLGIISPGTVLMYLEADNIDEKMISTKLLLPRDWQAASALPRTTSATAAKEEISYEETSLRNFVDSPIMCGRCYRSVELVDSDALAKSANAPQLAPHTLHLFSEIPSALNLDVGILNCLKAMVVQTAKLTGSQPFDHFDILLAITDELPANGLEHSRSTLNVLPTSALRSKGALKGWSRLLIPHEYLHAWCGKYRRPAEMVVSDFHTAKGTDLLWVYEGLTQYLGEVIEARSGLMNIEEFRDRVSVELRNALHQQNRHWRPLVDTAAASHVLRDGSRSWPKLRGGQDYYMEGMLFWLEADAVIRTQSKGKKSLDDFCHKFFMVTKGPTATKEFSKPKAFTREEIISTLQAIAPYDWEGLIRRRVESTRETFDPQVATLLGYDFKPSANGPRIAANTFRFPGGIDHLDTLGLMLSGDGVVTDIRLESVADRAKLAPGMKIIGIEGRKWNRATLEEAVQQSANSPAINLLVEDGEYLRPVQLQYYDGPRYLSLNRVDGKEDLLERILQSL